MLAGLAAQALPAIGGAALNQAGQFINNRMASAQGQQNVGSAQGVVDFGRQNGLMIDPSQQMQMGEDAARNNAQFQQGMSRSDTTFGAALGNQVANLNNQRAMALNAQANAANMAGQQLQNAANRAQANAMAIQGAIGSGLGLAR